MVEIVTYYELKDMCEVTNNYLLVIYQKKTFKTEVTCKKF
jgi:hypothetical protein